MADKGPAQKAKPNEEAFRLLVDSIVDYAIFMLSPQGHVTTWNRGAQQMKGYENEDILGAHFSVFYPPEDVASGKPARELKIAADKGRFEDEGWRLRKDGSRFWANVVITALRDSQGVLHGFSKVTRDLTRKKLEEERFRVVVEAAPNAMIMVDKEGAIVLVNSQTEKLFGYPRQELLHKPIEILVPERFRGQHPGHRRSFFAAPQARAMGAGRDLYGLLKNGREVPIEIGLNPIETPEGNFVLASIIDITERKRAEERLRLVVEAAPNAMIMVDKDGAIVLVNSQTEKLFGYPRQELLHKPIEILVPERFRGQHPGHRRSFFAAPQARAMGAGRDLYGLLKDGREVPIEIGLNPLETQEGTFVLASIIDITERKRAEEFRTAKEAMEAVTREMETFSYSCAHDLRAPLRKIAGFSEALANDSAGKLSAQSQDYLQRVQNNVLQMDGIIEGLLKLSRVLQQEPKAEPVDLSRLVKDIADELQKTQPARQVRFVIAPAVAVQGDPEFLRIILRNLLENSWKFTTKHPQAKIEFGVTKKGAQTVYYVRDDGAGFDMAHADKLFGAFKRLHAPGNFSGAGIGLATVRRVVQRHGGRIWAEAQVERGATFYFTLGTRR